jgi:hypothetical protein
MEELEKRISEAKVWKPVATAQFTVPETREAALAMKLIAFYRLDPNNRTEIEPLEKEIKGKICNTTQLTLAIAKHQGWTKRLIHPELKTVIDILSQLCKE